MKKSPEVELVYIYKFAVYQNLYGAFQCHVKVDEELRCKMMNIYNQIKTSSTKQAPQITNKYRQ